MTDVFMLVIGAVVGLAIGFIIARAIASSARKREENEAQSILDSARTQAETIKKEAEIEAKDEAFKIRQSAESEKNERLKEARAAEDRLNQREKSLDHRSDSLDSREHQISSLQGQVEKRERDLKESERKLKDRHVALDEEYEAVNRQLEKVAGLTADEAKEELLANLKDQVAVESATIIRESEARAKAEADKKSREILSLAIQRVAADHSAEVTVSTISIPSDDLKGRIIGREGRNIRSFEQLTGTNLIIDDTPECVTISCFDPVRREIGRVTMENLVADGRIHPARIEEMFKKAEKLVNQKVKEAGEKATFESGVHDLHPDLEQTLGRLLFRTSYGQNVLTIRSKLRTWLASWRLNWGLTLFQQSVLVFCMTLAKPSTTKLTVAMPLLVQTLHVVLVKSLKSCMLSKPIITMSSPTACLTFWFKLRTRYRLHVLARVRKRSTLM